MSISQVPLGQADRRIMPRGKTIPPDGPSPERAAQDVQIRTFLIADVRGYTLFTQERGDEAAAKLAAKFADIAREVIEGAAARSSSSAATRPSASSLDPRGHPCRGRPPAAVRRRDARTAGAAAHGGDRARCRRGRRRPGRLPRRCAEPRRPALRPGSSRRDPRLPRGHPSRPTARRHPVRGPRSADVQGHRRPGRGRPRRARRRGPGRSAEALRAGAAGAGEESPGGGR